MRLGPSVPVRNFPVLFSCHRLDGQQSLLFSYTIEREAKKKNSASRKWPWNRIEQCGKGIMRDA